ncbi:MAG: low molecular weight protein-tyrosine-phosphatase [Gammaproteobacteria bacterium]
MKEQVAVLMVCMGNICRSPTAHGVFRQRIRSEGLEGRVLVDSAGTHAYHVGEAPDPRAQRAALSRGIHLGDLRARAVRAEDFERFDYLLAMDHDNYAHLAEHCPAEYRPRLRLFLEFAPHLETREVPDPYYGGSRGFEHVLDLVEAASEGLLNQVRRDLGLL